MSGGWLELHSAAGVRREVLRAGLTRVGGGSAEIPVAGVGADQLWLWDRPPRARFEGRGDAPRLNGEVLGEHALTPGDRIDWAGVTLVFGGAAADAPQATLEELVEPTPTVTGESSPSDGERLALRVRAGIACELELAERTPLKRWQEAVLAERFEPDACARELLATTFTREAEQRMLERSGTLLRDFLMSSYLRGAQGAGRKLRGGLRNVLAFLLAQLIALAVFTLIVVAILLVLRVKGESLDRWLDRVIDLAP
ncbi:MAG: hypothetical protein ABL998_18390 [Planctomycetota bacterium]